MEEEAKKESVQKCNGCQYQQVRAQSNRNVKNPVGKDCIGMDHLHI